MHRNLELIDKTYEAILADPSTWNQLTWAQDDNICGTTYCFAGHAVLQAGGRIIRVETPQEDRCDEPSCCGPRVEFWAIPPDADPADEESWQAIVTLAHELLDPQEEGIFGLFEATNTLDRIGATINALHAAEAKDHS